MKDPLVPVTETGLDILEWFGQWTPEVYRYDWKRYRQRPPGFRAMLEMAYAGYAQAAATDRVAPHHKIARRVCLEDLLPYGLLEGAIGFFRLTPRGRAALKLAGRVVPEVLTSHCGEIFDDFDLTPHSRTGEKLEDLESTWRNLLRVYEGDAYSDMATRTRASATLTQVGGLIYCNGSFREHSRVVSLVVRNGEGLRVCEFYCSTEQFTDLLTSRGSVPVTVQSYFGRDGVRRQEPAPPPVNIRDRMGHRIDYGIQGIVDRLTKTMESVEGLKMGKRAKEDLLFDLKVTRDNLPANVSSAVTQAVEDVSKIVEGMVTLLSERQLVSGEQGPQIGPGAIVRSLMEGGVIEVDE